MQARWVPSVEEISLGGKNPEKKAFKEMDILDGAVGRTSTNLLAISRMCSYSSLRIELVGRRIIDYGDLIHRQRMNAVRAEVLKQFGHEELVI
jgi:hypothetical protein